MNEYDITEAFQAIEKELIDSMMRNVNRHKSWEKEEGFNWSMWQAEQLNSLKEYRLRNKKQFNGYFNDINDEIEEMLKKSYRDGNMQQEVKILEAIKNGYEPPSISDKVNELMVKNKGVSLRKTAASMLTKYKGTNGNIDGEFFKINDRKLNALISATKSDFNKAEIAMLRMSNDQYRKIIFNAEVYANTGAGTIEKAIDMATKDFLSKGINCIEYKNGARVNITDYVSMAIQTANKRAYLQGEGAKRQEWGISTVIVISRGGGCPKCTPFQGKVFIDDVWSGGKATDGSYPLLSSAIAKGFYHPRCKDSHTTYFEGITTVPRETSKKEHREQVRQYNEQIKLNYTERQIKKYNNLEQKSIDKENIKKYRNRRVKWEHIKNKFKNTSTVIENYGNDDIIKVGAISGALNQYSDEAQAHAEIYYESVRHMKSDFKSIAKNVGWKEDSIAKIKEHIFIKKHDLGNAEKEHFYPSYDMAQSWQRLIQGKEIKEQDLVLLKHEYLELTLMKNGFSQTEAHFRASKIHDFASYTK